MTSKKDDKNFCAAVSNFIYGLLAQDLNSERRFFFDSSITEIRFVVPFPSFVNALHPAIIVISKDALQDIIVQQQCISKIGFVLYKCQQHHLLEVTKVVLHDAADPSACVLAIDDCHSSLTPFEHVASFSHQFRSILHLMKRVEVLRETSFDDETFGRSGRIIGSFLQASDSTKIVDIRWKFDSNFEVWLASNNILTSNIIKQILSLPGVQGVRTINRPPFFTTLAATDRICIQIRFKHQGAFTKELVNKTLIPLNTIALKLFSQECIEFQRKCIFLHQFPEVLSNSEETISCHKMCTFSVEALDDSQILTLASILRDLKLFFYVLPRKTLFLYGSGAILETLRMKSNGCKLRIPLGRKQGSLQLRYEGLAVPNPQGRILKEVIGEITREAVQICNRPDLFDEDGTACPEIVKQLTGHFCADNFTRLYVRGDDMQAVCVLSFDIPNMWSSQLPIPFCIDGHEPFIIQFLSPLMNPNRFVTIQHPAENKTDAFMNSYKHLDKRQYKVSSIAALHGSSNSFARFQMVTPHLFIKDNESSIPCLTLDEAFPWVFSPNPLSQEEFEAISNYFATERLYFQHHSWIQPFLQIPEGRSLEKHMAGPGIYHVRLQSWNPATLYQPRIEAGRVVIGRSNALRALVYEHSDMIIFVPAGGALEHVFSSLKSFNILRHRALSRDDTFFEFGGSQDMRSETDQQSGVPWTQNDFITVSQTQDNQVSPMVSTQSVPATANTENQLPDAPMDDTTTVVPAGVSNSHVPHIEKGESTMDDISGDASISSNPPNKNLFNTFSGPGEQDQQTDFRQKSVKPDDKVNSHPPAPTKLDSSISNKSVGKSSPVNNDSDQVTNAIVPISLSTKKSTGSSALADDQGNSSEATKRLVLLRTLEVKDFVGKDSSLTSLKISEQEFERAGAFLLHLPNVSCYYVTATRVISKAAWTKDHGLKDEDLQSFVLKEIAKGWTLSKYRPKSKFDRRHLALVLGAYTTLDPMTIDSFQDAIINIFRNMIPVFHQVFCAQVRQTCSLCSNTYLWHTPFFDSTIRNYDALNPTMLPDIFKQCLPTKEGFPGTNDCCSDNGHPQEVKEASIKIVNLQFFQCSLPNAQYHRNLLLSDPFLIEDTYWTVCALVIHSHPNHFYTIERPDQRAQPQQPVFVKHDNAVGYHRACNHLKANDVIVAFVFRKSEVKPMWSNVGVTRAVRKHMHNPNLQDTGNKESSLEVNSGRVIGKHKQISNDQKRIQGIRKLITKTGKLSTQAMKLSPSKITKKAVNRFNDSNKSPTISQASSLFAHKAPLSGVYIHVPDSDEERHIEQNTGCSDDPISNFSTPNNSLDQHPVHPIRSSSHKALNGSVTHPAADQRSTEKPICYREGSKERVNKEQSPQPSRPGEPLGSSGNLPSKHAPYALISLFDGCGSTFHILKDAVGYPPHVFIAVEWDLHLRAIVADALSLALDDTWHFNKFHTKSLYVADADKLFLHDAIILRQFIALLPPNCKVFVIGGSPCTELTVGGADQGLLGLSGPSSCFFFNIHLVLYYLQSMLPKTHIRFLVENAGSMLPLHSKFIMWTLGILDTPLETFAWDAKILGLAERKRFFFQNIVNPRAELAVAPQPFPPGWGPLPFFDGNKLGFVTAKVFMRPREEINDGLVQRSWSAYHPYSLIWNYEFFGSAHQLADMAKISSHNRVPQLDWARFVPSMFLAAWKRFLRVVFDYSSTFRDKDDAIRAILPLFHNPKVQLPFRLITAREAAIMSGIQSSFDHATRFPFLHTDFVVLSAVGNSFHPTLIATSLGTRQHIHDWLEGTCHSSIEVAAPQDVIQRFAPYLTEITRLTQGKHINKQSILTPYRRIKLDISISKPTSPPEVLPLQFMPSIPRELQRPAMEQKMQQLKNKRLRMIDLEVVHLLSTVGFADTVSEWYAPLFFPLKEVSDTLIRKNAEDQDVARFLIHSASQAIQILQTYDTLVMCLWSLFSGRTGADHRASLVAVFKANAAAKPIILVCYGNSPRDLYVVVHHPERLEIALAGVHDFQLNFEAVASSSESNIHVQHVPVIHAVHFNTADILGFVVPKGTNHAVGLGTGSSACIMNGCPFFDSLCLYKLVVGRANEVTTDLPCHALSNGIPIAFAYANCREGIITIGRAFHKHPFDWANFCDLASSPPILLGLVFVSDPQELVIGKTLFNFPSDDSTPPPNIERLLAWTTLSAPRHQCGFHAVHTFGAIIIRNSLSAIVMNMQ